MKVSFGGNYLLTLQRHKRNDAYSQIHEEHFKNKNGRFQKENLYMAKIDNDKILLLTGNDYDTFCHANIICSDAGCLGYHDSIEKAFAEKALKIDLTRVNWGNFDEF